MTIETRETRRRFAIVAIVKNEADYLLEWIAYHRCAGFDHFHLADNGSTDGTAALLQALERAGVVSYTWWPVAHKAQFQWYNHAIDSFASTADYLTFLDADEFLVPRVGVRATAHLARLLEPSDVGAIAINWQIYGSAGQRQRQPGLVLERFTHASNPERLVNTHVKSVVKPACVARMWSHTAELRGAARYLDANGDVAEFVNGDSSSGRSQAVIASPLTVRHYAVKSEQEFVENKSRRGRANLGSDARRGMSYFDNHDINDYCAPLDQSLLDGVGEEIGRLGGLIGGK
ncbi:MAG: glycosyltransferase family 2 protein [Pseudomonadales bacterium]